MPNDDFHYLTNVTPGHLERETCPPRDLRKTYRVPAYVSEQAFLAKQALSIWYLADHCRALRIFTLHPQLGKRTTRLSRGGHGRKSTNPESTEAVVKALTILALKCQAMDTIGITLPQTWRMPKDTARLYCRYGKNAVEDSVVSLAVVPWYLREDTVLDEARMTSKALVSAAQM
jgi:hypothetical protein